MTRARPALPPGPYLVVGLARSGTAAARTLAAHGPVIACDPGAPAEARALLGLAGVELHLGTDGVELVPRARTLVKSPGVPQDAPAVAAARAAGLTVAGELELAWRLLPHPWVAVTGTNGKTTTVELLGAIHRAAGLAAAVAGNVGMPLASLVGDVEPDATVIAEASSFQLEDASAFAPEGAVLLNVEPDHLDRHGSLERYRAAKMKVFAHGPAFSVMPSDLERDPFDLGEVRLRGEHNRQNARAAALVADAMGVPRDAVRAALGAFAGAPHRLEEVAMQERVLYVNDSKATNVASAVCGVEAFDRGVHVILGGSLKGEGFGRLREALSSRASAAYLIGDAEEDLARDLEGAVPLVRSGTLESAVAGARAAAKPGDVVLLSPACASFDAFRDYEERGERFRELVLAAE